MNLDGDTVSNPLLRRYSVMLAVVRRAKRVRQATWKKRIFRLNVFSGEFERDIETIAFDEEEERDDAEAEGAGITGTGVDLASVAVVRDFVRRSVGVAVSH